MTSRLAAASDEAGELPPHVHVGQEIWGVGRGEQRLTATFVVPTVASSVDLVVHLGMDAAGHRRVREIVGVTGRVEGDVIETTEVFTTVRGRLERGDGYPPRPERYEAVGIDLIRTLEHRQTSVASAPALREA
jgi:pilus assembly protein CpaF